EAGELDEVVAAPEEPPRTPRRIWTRRDSRGRTTSISPPECLRDLRRADRRAHLRKQPVRFAELALAGDVIAAEPRALRRLRAYDRLKNVRRSPKRFSESGFDCAPRLEPPRSKKHISWGELRMGLVKPASVLAHERHRLFRRSDSTVGVPVSGVRHRKSR